MKCPHCNKEIELVSNSMFDYSFPQTEKMTYDKFLELKIYAGALTKKHHKDLVEDLYTRINSEQNEEQRKFLKSEKDWLGTFWNISWLKNDNS